MPREAPKGERIRIHLYNISLLKIGGHISGRWQAPAAVSPEGPKNIEDSHSRARRARGRAKLSLRFGACQCYYMFFTIQPKIAIFMAKFKYLHDGQNA